MEKRFREALLKVLADKTFKNVSALCGAANVDQGGVNAFILTMKYRAGERSEPARIKDNMNLDVVSKLVDAMGGELVFPWDSPEANSRQELEKANKEIARKDEEIIGLRAKNETLLQLVRDRLA